MLFKTVDCLKYGYMLLQGVYDLKIESRVGWYSLNFLWHIK